MATVSKKKRRKKKKNSNTQPVEQQEEFQAGDPQVVPFYFKTGVLAGLSALLMWLCLPSLSWSPLAFVALVPLLCCVRSETLQGKRPYLSIYIAGVIFWLFEVHWVRFPHPATSAGWVLMSLVMGMYFPIFVGSTRLMTNRLKVPLWLVAPIIWVGLEYFRAYFISGFSMAYLGHALYKWIPLIQISDITGAYGISFLAAITSGVIASCIPWQNTPKLPWIKGGVILSISFGIVLGYGFYRLSEDPFQVGPKIGLVQVPFESNLATPAPSPALVIDSYYSSSKILCDAEPNLDLVVWPEAMYREAHWIIEDNTIIPKDSPTQDVKELQERAEIGMFLLQQRVSNLKTPMCVGIDVKHRIKDITHSYNSAMFIDPSKGEQGRYDKSHLVMFGEYIPWAETFPFLYDFTPVTGSSRAGDPDQLAVEMNGFQYMTNICFESCVPQRIRHQVNFTTEKQGKPDVLVNLTNDGWFRKSNELELHLICGVFRAVEHRCDFVSAANTGITSWISSTGKIKKRSPVWSPELLIAETQKDSRISFYTRYGDCFAGSCFLLMILGYIASYFKKPNIPIKENTTAT